jgi:DNA repair photolyase
MIVPYWGEFLVTPSPLELSLNHCANACSYCFANLNEPDRTADMQALMRLLADYQNRETYVATLMKEGYPTVVSNRTDPFASNNYLQTLSLLEVMGELGLPVAMQTKGGQGIDEALSLMKPSVWYVSIATLNDEVRGRVEPAAPAISNRLAMVEKLIERGHKVVVGVNPCVPEWLGDPQPIMQALKERGVWGVWIERLHFNYKQVNEMKPWAKEAVTPEIIARSQKRKLDPEEFAFILDARSAAMDAGLEVYSVGQPVPSKFMQSWAELYPKVFPTAQDFVNHCDANQWQSRLITFEDFVGFFTPLLPAGKMGIDSYLGSVAHNLWWTHKVPPQMTFRELLGIIFCEPRTRNCPVRMPCFAYAAKLQDDGWTQYVDEQGMPYLVYSPDGFESYYAHVDLQGEGEAEDEPLE